MEKGVRSGIEDVSIVATYIMLQAIELGVYSTLCNYFSNTELEKTFAIPQNEKVVLIMPVGYKAENVQPSPAHESSKEQNALVTYL